MRPSKQPVLTTRPRTQKSDPLMDYVARQSWTEVPPASPATLHRRTAAPTHSACLGAGQEGPHPDELTGRGKMASDAPARVIFAMQANFGCGSPHPAPNAVRGAG